MPNSASERSESDSSVKISANLPAEDVGALKQLAAQRRVTMTSVLRDAIAAEKYLSDIVAQGGKVLVEDARGAVHRVFASPPPTPHPCRLAPAPRATRAAASS